MEPALRHPRAFVPGTCAAGIVRPGLRGLTQPGADGSGAVDVPWGHRPSAPEWFRVPNHSVWHLMGMGSVSVHVPHLGNDLHERLAHGLRHIASARRAHLRLGSTIRMCSPTGLRPREREGAVDQHGGGRLSIAGPTLTRITAVGRRCTTSRGAQGMWPRIVDRGEPCPHRLSSRADGLSRVRGNSRRRSSVGRALHS